MEKSAENIFWQKIKPNPLINVDQRFNLVHQMCIWDRNTYNDIILSYGKKATNIAGGITYGISDIFPED